MDSLVGALLLHRVDFINILIARLDSEITTVHFSKRLVSYILPPKSSPTAPITLAFKDGTTSTCDVLIAADGIHSATRHTMLGLAAIDAEAPCTAGELHLRHSPRASGAQNVGRK
ncbi:hypothetical protein EW145_g2715 [Phellinidium pouzarii]|uniref:FAD-binding domain-containing protein n=1 Tax=Phellinidium pouzarii TaxID=167371 RepID=A0A4S4LBS4_9AGAM|nr:hypothetical protein EW145_g2715 [Phellinidium pouzarii]